MPSSSAAVVRPIRWFQQRRSTTGKLVRRHPAQSLRSPRAASYRDRSGRGIMHDGDGRNRRTHLGLDAGIVAPQRWRSSSCALSSPSATSSPLGRWSAARCSQPHVLDVGPLAMHPPQRVILRHGPRHRRKQLLTRKQTLDKRKRPRSFGSAGRCLCQKQLQIRRGPPRPAASRHRAQSTGRHSGPGPLASSACWRRLHAARLTRSPRRHRVDPADYAHPRRLHFQQVHTLERRAPWIAEPPQIVNGRRYGREELPRQAASPRRIPRVSSTASPPARTADTPTLARSPGRPPQQAPTRGCSAVFGRKLRPARPPRSTCGLRGWIRDERSP